ncbi:MAG: radical SAM protein [Verrucomicrobiota bacterium]|nr:radical SAM protein [Verrucomicrobiota bacterium]
MDQDSALQAAFRHHPRDLDRFRYVYCVVSRRAGGLSIGINLNPDKVCNFDCVYCQVDRSAPTPKIAVNLALLEQELVSVLKMASDGSILQNPRFQNLSPEHCRPKDIAFAGDGEPTSFPRFDLAVEAVFSAQAKAGLPALLPVVVMTNATGLGKPAAIRAVDRIYEHGGEIWAKLDAGTEEFFHRVSGTRIPFSRILKNLTATAQRHPIVLQSMFMHLHGQGPTQEELTAYCDRVREILAAGGTIRLIQVYTVARQPAQSYVAPLPKDEQNAIGDFIRNHTGVTVELFY